MGKTHTRGFKSAVRLLNAAAGKNEDMSHASKLTPADRAKAYSAAFRKQGATVNDVLQRIKARRLIIEELKIS